MDAKRAFARNRKKLHPESGQTIIFVLLVLGIFFLAFIGLAVDYSHLWFHRQTAQAAADAACQAGAMDLLVDFSGGGPNQGGFTPGSSFDCKDFPNSAPCRYATLNGYTGAALTANTPGTNVTVSFPGSVPGTTAPPISIASVPFLRVDVIDRAQVYFSGLLTGNHATDVRAFAVCGLQLAKAPIPIIVLNPSCQHSLEVSGAATLQVAGGPTKSVQVNSTGGNQVCAAATQSSANGCSGSGTVDLSAGGPNFTGSNFGTFGGPPGAPSKFNGGVTGSWGLGSPVGDPYSLVPAPTKPAILSPTNGLLPNSTAPIPVPYGVDGCPDNKGCVEYLPGWYNKPIFVKSQTAIFVPGVYYIKPTSYTNANNGQSAGYCGKAGAGCTSGGNGQCTADFIVESNGVVRPAGTLTTAAALAALGHDSKGTMFYLSGPGGAGGYGGAVFTANAGKAAGGHTIDPYPATNLSCDGSVPNSKLNVPSSLDGNILLAQCTAQGNYLGTPSTDTFSATGVRGLLMFQDHANGDQQGQSTMQGGGGFALSGTLYSHNCTASPCNAFPTDYNAFIQLQGAPGSGTFILGEIVTDQLVESGTGSIGMQLNPNAVYFILKASMLR